MRKSIFLAFSLILALAPLFVAGQDKRQIIIPPSADTTVIDLSTTVVTTPSITTTYQTTVRKTVTVPPVVIVTPPAGSALPTRAPDFDGSKLIPWPVKAGNIAEGLVAGKQALTFTVTPTMTEVAGGRRSEVNLYSQKNKDPFSVWLTESIYIPSTTIPDNPLLYDVITQFHDPNEKPTTKLRKSPFDLVLSGSTLRFQIRTDKDLDGTTLLSVPVAYDRWMGIAMNIVFSGSGKGKLQVWVDGKEALNYTGYVGFSGDVAAPFLKIGDYFFAWNSNDPSQLSYVKSKQRQLSIADFKIWYQ